MAVEIKKKIVDPKYKKLSVLRQCQLIELSRSNYYRKPKGLTEEDDRIIRKMDEVFTEHPYYGTRRMMHVLRSEGVSIGRKKVRTYYQLLGIEAVYPKMNLSKRNYNGPRKRDRKKGKLRYNFLTKKGVRNAKEGKAI